MMMAAGVAAGAAVAYCVDPQMQRDVDQAVRSLSENLKSMGPTIRPIVTNIAKVAVGIATAVAAAIAIIIGSIFLAIAIAVAIDFIVELLAIAAVVAFYGTAAALGLGVPAYLIFQAIQSMKETGNRPTCPISPPRAPMSEFPRGAPHPTRGPTPDVASLFQALQMGVINPKEFREFMGGEQACAHQ